MANYAIGDVQGCYDELMRLLDSIVFDENNDTLWFVGDLVNRGPKSLEVLRFVHGLKNKAKVVLGNHDMHLLAIYYGFNPLQVEHNFADILNASDCDELLNWLRYLPFLYHDEKLNYVMAHAGIAPMWSLQKAKELAKEVEAILQSFSVTDLLQHMYGDLPDLWDDNLQGFERYRLIINYFTRMRLCDKDGRLYLKEKGGWDKISNTLTPWFFVPNRVAQNERILFGHWASLKANVKNAKNVYGLDAGCVWGGKLLAMRLEDGAFFGC